MGMIFAPTLGFAALWTTMPQATLKLVDRVGRRVKSIHEDAGPLHSYLLLTPISDVFNSISTGPLLGY